MDIYKKHNWGNIYYRWLRKGYDHGYAAYMADQFCKRKERELKRKDG